MKRLMELQPDSAQSSGWDHRDPRRPPAHWVRERFPEAGFPDVEGLVKLVDRTEIEAHDWSLTLGRYVDVAPEEDEDVDFDEALRVIHVDLKGLNDQARNWCHVSPGISRN